MVVKKVTSAAGEEHFFILPPRASRTFNFFYTTSASLPDVQLFLYYLREPPGANEFFLCKTSHF